MLDKLLGRLSLASAGQELLEVLLDLRPAISHISSASELKKFENALVSLCCQNKNLAHWNVADKPVRQTSLQRLYDILLDLCNLRKDSRTRITDLFISHVDHHPSCYISLSIFLKLLCSSQDILQLVRKERFNNVLGLLEAVCSHTPEAKDLRHMSELRKKQRSTRKDLILVVEEQLASIAKPTEMEEPRSTEITSKIPPLLLPTSKSINSSRYSLGSKDEKRKGLDELIKLGVSLGETAIGVELGCLLAKRRISQVNKYSENSGFIKASMEQIQTERDLSARGLHFQDMSSIVVQCEDSELVQKHYRRVIVIIANIIFKCIEKEYELDEISNPDQWLTKFFDILMVGLIPHFNTESLKPKGLKMDFGLNLEGILLPKEIVFAKLFNICGLISENIHLTIRFAKNSPSDKERSIGHFQNDPLLGKVTIQKNKINKKLLSRMGIGNFDRQNLKTIRDSSNKFLLLVKNLFEKIFESYDASRPRSHMMLTSLLSLLDNYLRNSQSKITAYENIQLLMDHLILVKRILMELSLPFLKNSAAQVEMLEASMKSRFTKKTRLLEMSRQVTRPLVYQNTKLMAAYLSVLGSILTSHKHVEKLFSNIFLKNGGFLQLVQAYTRHLFEQDQSEQIFKVLNFYRKFAQAYHNRKLRNQDSRPAKTILEGMSYLFMVRDGLITNYLRDNDKIITGLLETQVISDTATVRKIIFMRELLQFIEDILCLCPELNPLLEDDNSSFYLKFCFLNFVKLYSYLTVSELEYIKQAAESADCKFSPQSQPTNSNNFYKQGLMVGFLQILINLSVNRTDQIAKKMRQYRVLQFFVRQLELEFCIRDYRHKLLKTEKPKSTDKKVQTKLDVKSGKQKPIVPNLSLKAHRTVEEDPEQNKPTKKSTTHKTQQRSITNETEVLDKIMVQIAKGDSKPKMIVPALKLGASEQKGGNKPQLALNLHNLDQLREQARKPDDDRVIYQRERRIRKIYSSRTIHSCGVLLVLSLLLKQGLLDPLYCDQYPIMKGKINVLYILHHHLNHQANYSILNHLTQGVSRIRPYPAGQRLLKLLAIPFTNMSIYTQWQRMNEGAYGKIFSCKTNLANPHQVAIKQMELPDSIYERCVLNDIFTEITCLENFRLDPKVTDIYDYGVTQSSYVIIMKKYLFSLKKWRSSIENPSLPILLNVFHEILKVVKLLHEHSVTHYDIKADNILLDCESEETLEEGKFVVVFGDFGECKIYQGEKEELDLRPRGTECNKSPEMLTVSSQSRRDSENYDRRKKIGTTKSSDIWSLGCLFFELMTGEYLFDTSVWIWTTFFLHLTSTDKKQLLSQRQTRLLGNNIYLIDFLKFMLIKQPQHRPSIDSIIKRFENVYGLLVPNANVQLSNRPSPLQFNATLENLLEEYIVLMERCPQVAPSITKNKFGGLLKIMEDIYFCDEQYFKKNRAQIVKEGISHVISTFPVSKLFSMVIHINSENIASLPFRVAPKVSDFLRQVLLIFKGKLLLVNNSSNYAVVLLIYCLSLWFRCTIFQTWCLINTQILDFPMSSDYLPILSQALFRFNKIQEHIESLPKLQCICGSVTFILKRNFSQSHKEVRICKCKKKSHENSMCPTSGCQAYLDFLKKRFNIQWDHLKWNLLNLSNFLVGPMRSGKIQDPMRIEILINSAEPSQNMVQADPNLKPDWKVYKCKVCEMWMLAIGQDKKVWVLMNNQIKSIRQGIMIPNAQQNFKIRTPVLNNFTLSKLHMISQ